MEVILTNYYLGYKDLKNNRTEKIDLPGVESDIASIASFTMKFEDETSLKSYLKEKGLLPEGRLRLMYLIEKGKKNEKYLIEVPGYTHIFTKDSISFFNSKAMARFINEHKYEPEFTLYLYYSYLKKMGLKDKIKQHFTSLINKPETLNKELMELINIPLSKELKNGINRLIEYIQNTKPCNLEVVSSSLNIILEKMVNSSVDLVNTYSKLINKFTFNKVPAIQKLRKIYSVSNLAYNMGVENFKYSQEFYQDISNDIVDFINLIIYKYDTKSKSYVMQNGKRVIKKREMFDLGSILEGYEMYLLELEEYRMKIEEASKKQQPSAEFDEDAEFLTKEDFAPLGYTPEEAKIKIRQV